MFTLIGRTLVHSCTLALLEKTPLSEACKHTNTLPIPHVSTHRSSVINTPLSMCNSYRCFHAAVLSFKSGF